MISVSLIGRLNIE